MNASALGFLCVFVGGGIGSMLRHGVNRLAASLLGGGFPIGTLLINVSGSFVMGLVTGWFLARGGEASQTARLFLTTGVLGGFTTFSAFSLETALLWQRGQSWQAGGYVVGSVAISLAGVFAGLALTR